MKSWGLINHLVIDPIGYGMILHDILVGSGIILTGLGPLLIHGSNIKLGFKEGLQHGGDYRL